MWGFLADVFSREQSHRLFAWIAGGGTAGGIVAAWASGLIADWMGRSGAEPAWLLWLAIVLLELGTWCALRFARHARPSAWRPPEAGRTVGDHLHDVMEGVRLFVRSPYLLAIAGYMFVSLYTSSVLYSYQRELVKAGIAERAAQVEYNANLNTWTQIVAIIGQLLVAAPLLRRAGTFVTLSILHVLGAVVLIAFGYSPTLPVIAFAWVAVKGIDYSLAKPTRETLFTVVSRAEKYQSKSLIDAGLYRFFDFIDSWIMDGFRAVHATAAFVAFTAAPISLLGVWVSRRLAREHARRREVGAAASVPSEEAVSG
jgi:AAA family ATP:ADP antiporter